LGGGFFGASIAIYLAKTRGFKNVKLIEKNPSLLEQASYRNQARVHGGYHYPRSSLTAARSQINLPRFMLDWPDAVTSHFTSVYAVARSRSKTTGKQFRRFCQNNGLKIEEASQSIAKHFNLSYVEDLMIAREYVFDSTVLAQWARNTLEDCGVEIHLETHATSIRSIANDRSLMTVDTLRLNGLSQSFKANFVFNCSYSGLNSISGEFEGTTSTLKHEIAEIALIEPPEELEDIGITVMDGPFFSLMPFPADGLHSLSHVSYTPHSAWTESKNEPGSDPYARLAAYPKISNYEKMMRDASRFVPKIRNSEYKKSLYEVKTVLLTNEIDDGRPILFEKDSKFDGLYSILGGKIDNVYDVLSRLDREDLRATPR
jgi:glycine/D-amino acid oxidase-like deaminating enzyme